MINVITNKHLFFPIKLSLIFLIFTEIFLFLGPIDYDIDNSIQVLFFFFVVNLALYFGYRSGINASKISPKRKSVDKTKLLHFILVFSAIFTIPRTTHALGIASFSPQLIIQQILRALNDPNEVYMEKLALEVSDVSYINLIFSAITYMAIPLGVFYWKKLNARYKITVIYILLMEIILWLGVGTRKGVFDVILIISILLIARNVSAITSFKKSFKYYFILGIGSISFIYYFIYSNLSRYSLNSITDFANHVDKPIKPFFLEYIPTSITMLLYSIQGYLCGGYYALTKALALDEICFSYGMGNSWFHINIAEKLDLDMLQYTYQQALYTKFDIHPYYKWHSIYVWLANDFTFWGTPIVIFLIGRLYAQAWVDTIFDRSFYAPVVLSLMFAMVIYFFANNQIVSFSFVPLFTSIALWKLNRRKIS